MAEWTTYTGFIVYLQRQEPLQYLYLLYFAFRFIGWAVAVLSKKDE
jgi:hypothetical protein